MKQCTYLYQLARWMVLKLFVDVDVDYLKIRVKCSEMKSVTNNDDVEFRDRFW